MFSKGSNLPGKSELRSTTGLFDPIVTLHWPALAEERTCWNERATIFNGNLYAFWMLWQAPSREKERWRSEVKLQRSSLLTIWHSIVGNGECCFQIPRCQVISLPEGDLSCADGCRSYKRPALRRRGLTKGHVRTADVTHSHFIRLSTQWTMDVDGQKDILNGFVTLHTNPQSYGWNIRISITVLKSRLAGHLND